jgi:hypothetical protein
MIHSTTVLYHFIKVFERKHSQLIFIIFGVGIFGTVSIE